MGKQRHEWFIYAPHDNEAVAKYLQDGDNRFEESAVRDALCADGKRRDLWRCTETQAYFLWRNPQSRIKIFNRLGQNGKIRDVTFLFKKDRRSLKKKRKEAVR
ncbi:MAG: hypothetical protein AAB509_01400 [Patescibacteria group bacterium]